MGLPERVKLGVRDGKQLILQKTPVAKSPSGRFVWEYHVVYIAESKTVWRGMSRKYGLMYFRAELGR